MKHLQRIFASGFAVVLMALALVAASAASATTLEVGGSAKNEAVTIKASLKSGTSTLFTDTSGTLLNTCTGSAIEGKTASPFTGTTVSVPLASLTFTSCSESVTTDAPGSLSIEYISGTTNGTVRSLGAKWTTSSPFGPLTCVTAGGVGTDIGTLTGVASGKATLDITGVLDCGAITAKWTGTYTVTGPEGLGVSSTTTKSSTTLEVGGVAKEEALTVEGSLKSGTSALLKDTSGFTATTCTESSVKGTTSVFTGTKVEGPISSLTFGSCKEGPVVVESAGSLSVENIPGTTNGTVRSIGAKVSVPSTFGHLTCITAGGEGTDIGTLTGVASGKATLDITGVLDCGAITAKWTGTYTVTGPEGLGVRS
jgi:hypothetical protein